MATECSLLPHTALCYHTLRKVINNRSMPYSKAVLQALGSSDLTSSLASSCRLTLFLEHHVRTAAINLYISVHTQELSMMFGTMSSKEACIFIDTTPEDASRVEPSVTRHIAFYKQSDAKLYGTLRMSTRK